jgi:hypothetical protein
MGRLLRSGLSTHRQCALTDPRDLKDNPLFQLTGRGPSPSSPCHVVLFLRRLHSSGKWRIERCGLIGCKIVNNAV